MVACFSVISFQRNVYLFAQSKLASGPQPSVAFGGIGRKSKSSISLNICSKVTTFGSNSTVTLPLIDFAVALATPMSSKAFTTLFSQLPQRIPMQSKVIFFTVITSQLFYHISQINASISTFFLSILIPFKIIDCSPSLFPNALRLGLSRHSMY